VLVQFNAGRCAMDSSNRVTPTPGKGTVSISKVSALDTDEACPCEWSLCFGEQASPPAGLPGAIHGQWCCRGLSVPTVLLPRGFLRQQADGMTTFQWSNRESGEQDDVSAARTSPRGTTRRPSHTSAAAPRR